MKRITLLCLLAIVVGVFAAQAQTNVDSLINVLETQKLKPEEQLDIYEKICHTYLSLYDTEKNIVYAEKGLALAEKEKNPLAASKFNEYFAKGYDAKVIYDTAIVHYEKALILAKEAKDKEQETSVYLNMGNSYGKRSKYTLSLEYFLKALSLCEITGNKNQRLTALIKIGGMNRMLNNTKQAIYYMEQARILAEELDIPAKKMPVYYELAALCDVMGDIDKGLEYMLKVAEISSTIGDKQMEAISNQSLAMTYYGLSNNYEKAIDHINKSIAAAEKLGDPGILSGSWSALSIIYLDTKQWKESEKAALKAWELDSVRLDFAPNTALCITAANIYLGNAVKAINFLEKYKDLKNQYADKSFHEVLSDMEVKYETEKKELRIAALEKEKTFYIIIGITCAFILLLAFGLLFYRHRLNIQKRRLAEQQREFAEQQIKQLEQEKQLIAAQAVLDGETAERTRLARDLHDGLGGMLSVVKLNLQNMNTYSVMDNSDVSRFTQALSMLDKSINELRLVAHHIMPESLVRYGLKVSLEDFCRAIPNADFQYFGDDTRLDNRLEVMLYRCAHELINNAVKYAEADTISVQLMVDDQLVSLNVQDDGVGFDPEAISGGSGLENIRTRVSAHNGTMTLYTSPGKGTEVNIEITALILSPDGK
jgi:signal transduction histidine kinase